MRVMLWAKGRGRLVPSSHGYEIQGDEAFPASGEGVAYLTLRSTNRRESRVSTSQPSFAS